MESGFELKFLIQAVCDDDVVYQLIEDEEQKGCKDQIENWKMKMKMRIKMSYRSPSILILNNFDVFIFFYIIHVIFKPLFVVNLRSLIEVLLMKEVAIRSSIYVFDLRIQNINFHN